MADQMVKQTRQLRLAQQLFYLNAVIWLALAVASLLRLSTTERTPFIVLLVIAVLMLGNAAALLLAGWGLGRRNRWLYLFALGILAANILLTFTDQFGALDLLTLLLDVLLLALLWIKRRIYLNTAVKGRQA